MMGIKVWIVLGDTRVKITSWEQMEATCRLFNLTVVDDCEWQGYDL